MSNSSIPPFFLRPPGVLWGILLVGGLLLVGCEEEAVPDVTEGTYRAHVEGALTDTLSGPAVYRNRAGRLVGLELGTRDGAGLSIEVGPQPLRPGTYEVVAAELLENASSDSLTGTLAFLSVEGTQFEATRGTLLVTHVGDSEVRGTINFEMEERSTGRLPERSVRVRGELRATAGAGERGSADAQP